MTSSQKDDRDRKDSCVDELDVDVVRASSRTRSHRARRGPRVAAHQGAAVAEFRAEAGFHRRALGGEAFPAPIRFRALVEIAALPRVDVAAPVVLAWSTLAFQPIEALIAQWVGFTALWMADLRATNAGWSAYSSRLLREVAPDRPRALQRRSGTRSTGSTSRSSSALASLARSPLRATGAL